jgi:hypothetical protein
MSRTLTLVVTAVVLAPVARVTIAAQAPVPSGGQVRQPASEPAPRPADPGVTFVILMDRPEVRILRDTRRHPGRHDGP